MLKVWRSRKGETWSKRSSRGKRCWRALEDAQEDDVDLVWLLAEEHGDVFVVATTGELVAYMVSDIMVLDGVVMPITDSMLSAPLLVSLPINQVDYWEQEEERRNPTRATASKLQIDQNFDCLHHSFKMVALVIHN